MSTNNCKSVTAYSIQNKFSHIGIAFFPLSWAFCPTQATENSQNRAADVQLASQDRLGPPSFTPPLCITTDRFLRHRWKKNCWCNAVFPVTDTSQNSSYFSEIDDNRPRTVLLKQFLDEPILPLEDFGMEAHNICHISTDTALFLLCSDKNLSSMYVQCKFFGT